MLTGETQKGGKHHHRETTKAIIHSPTHAFSRKTRPSVRGDREGEHIDITMEKRQQANVNGTRTRRKGRRGPGGALLHRAATTCVCAAAVYTVTGFNNPAKALLVVQTPVRTCFKAGGGGEGVNWRGFRDARQARSVSLPTSYPSQQSSTSWCWPEASISNTMCGYRSPGRGRRSSSHGRRGRTGRGGVTVMSIWDLQGEEEWEFEEEVQRLERKMARASEKEDYKAAAKIRDKLFRCTVLQSSPLQRTATSRTVTLVRGCCDAVEKSRVSRHSFSACSGREP